MALYFNPSTGKLSTQRPQNSKAILMDENKLSAGGFFGGVASSIADSALLQGRTSESFVNAVRAINAKPIKLPEYYIDHYKIQSLQELGEEFEDTHVPIRIDLWQSADPQRWNVAPDWFEHIKKAIHDINFVVPGLTLFVTNDKSEAKITINGLPRSQFSCYTKIGLPVPEIYLNPLWREKKATSYHEL